MAREGADEAAGESRLPIEDEPERGSGRRDLAGLAIAFALFALAALIFGDATSYPERRSVAGMGPEVFPYLVSAGTVIMAVLTVVVALRGGFPVRERLNWGGLGWVLAAIVAQIALLYAGVGFILASAALFGLAARGFGQRPLWGTLAVGTVVSTVLYLLFRYGLGLALPAGPVERALAALIS